MDGYRQTLLGRALADALQELEKERGEDSGLDGDQLFSLFDDAMRLELRGQEVRTFTHESLDVTGQITAFNRFLDDWSVQARVATRGIQLDRSAADLHLPQRHAQEEGQKVAIRLKLRKRTS